MIVSKVHLATGNVAKFGWILEVADQCWKKKGHGSVKSILANFGRSLMRPGNKTFSRLQINSGKPSGIYGWVGVLTSTEDTRNRSSVCVMHMTSITRCEVTEVEMAELSLDSIQTLDVVEMNWQSVVVENAFKHFLCPLERGGAGAVIVGYLVHVEQ